LGIAVELVESDFLFDFGKGASTFTTGSSSSESNSPLSWVSSLYKSDVEIMGVFEVI